MTASDSFYKELLAFAEFTQFTDLKHYQKLPDDWYVVITDICGSTKAIQAGRYKDVNALGAASIMAMVNAVKPLSVPFVFGGDGATMCIPQSKEAAVAAALVAAREMAAQSFDMELRIGMVPVSVLTEHKCQVLVGKFQPSEHFQQAMFQGDGLGYAETLVKDPEPDNPYLIDHQTITADGDFTGFECRWNEIPSPHEETVAILVQAVGDHVAANYQKVSTAIADIYGDQQEHHPLREETLRLSKSKKKYYSRKCAFERIARISVPECSMV